MEQKTGISPKNAACQIGHTLTDAGPLSRCACRGMKVQGVASGRDASYASL